MDTAIGQSYQVKFSFDKYISLWGLTFIEEFYCNRLKGKLDVVIQLPSIKSAALEICKKKSRVLSLYLITKDLLVFVLFWKCSYCSLKHVIIICITSYCIKPTNQCLFILSYSDKVTINIYNPHKLKISWRYIITVIIITTIIIILVRISLYRSVWPYAWDPLGSTNWGLGFAAYNTKHGWGTIFLLLLLMCGVCIMYVHEWGQRTIFRSLFSPTTESRI